MVRFYVPRMACGGCFKRVAAAIWGVDPRAHIEPDLRAREVTITTTVTEPVLLDALNRAGYAGERRP